MADNKPHVDPNLKTAPPINSASLLLIAVTILTVAGGFVAVALQTSHPGDSTALIVIVLAFFSATIGVLLVLLKNISELHMLVNSRLGELVNEARTSALLKGRAEGVEQTTAAAAAAAVAAAAAATVATAQAVADAVTATATAQAAADRRETRAFVAGLNTPMPGSEVAEGHPSVSGENIAITGTITGRIEGSGVAQSPMADLDSC